MENVEKLRSWLMTYPKWMDGTFYTDYLDGVPGSAGLYPKGVETLSRQEDLMGNVTVQNRSRFVLRLVRKSQGDNAQWLLDLQNWVQRQSESGLAPRFGDDPLFEQLRAEKGCLHSLSQSGVATYEVTLTAQYRRMIDL